MKKLSVIIPALNEAEGIEKTIGSIPNKRISHSGFELEVLVIDGGSTDSTAEKAVLAGAKVITEPRRGYGRAYKTGFEAAKGEIVITLDADGTYPGEEIPVLLEYITKKGFDFISTNRFAKMDAGAMPLRNKLGNKVLSFFSKALFGLNFSDSQSGMWLFRREVWDRIKEKVKSDGMAFSQEIKIEAFRSGFSCCEVGIHYKRREGKVKLNAFRDGIGNLTNLFKKRLGS